jgi:hypothetical protein
MICCLQALGQHSKAVEDMTAAAAILPGDKEVRLVSVDQPGCFFALPT